MSRRAGKTYRPKISAGGLACGSARLSHKHNDNFTADFSAVYTPAFLDMLFIRRSWFDQEVTKQYSILPWISEYPTGIKAHCLKFTSMIAWMFVYSNSEKEDCDP